MQKGIELSMGKIVSVILLSILLLSILGCRKNEIQDTIITPNFELTQSEKDDRATPEHSEVMNTPTTSPNTTEESSQDEITETTQPSLNPTPFIPQNTPLPEVNQDFDSAFSEDIGDVGGAGDLEW